MDPSEITSASTDPSVYLSGTAAAFTASSIVQTFLEAVSKFVFDFLNYFSVTTLAITSSPASPIGMSSFYIISETTNVYGWSSVIPDA